MDIAVLVSFFLSPGITAGKLEETLVGINSPLWRRRRSEGTGQCGEIEKVGNSHSSVD